MSWGQLYLDCWNQGSPLALAGVFSPDCRYDDIVAGATFEGHAGIRRRLAEMRSEWPDFHFSYVAGFTNFDRYSLEWVMTGTAGAHPFVVNGVSVGCFDGCGRIAHNRDYRVAVASIVADPAHTPTVTTAPL